MELADLWQPLDTGYNLVNERLRNPEGNYFSRDNTFVKFIARTVEETVSDQLKLFEMRVNKKIDDMKKDIKNIKKNSDL